jgi:glycerol-3-phosphate cytidylyltransferase-like family protein
MCNFLKVGIHNDKDVEKYKRIPVLTMEERIKVVESCKYVDEVIPNAPIHVTPAFLKANNIQRVVHANDISQQSIQDMYGEIFNELLFVPYTVGISTTEIIKRVKTREDL